MRLPALDSLAAKIDWDSIVKLWLPLISFLGTAIFGGYQYYVNSRHERAATYLAVLDKFTLSQAEFDRHIGLITAPFLDRGEKSAAHLALASCKISAKTDWDSQRVCFNNYAVNTNYASVVAVLRQFAVLGQYASSDGYARDMLSLAMHDNAVLLATDLCGALTAVQRSLNGNLSGGRETDDLGGIGAINSFANAAVPCDQNIGKRQFPPAPS